MIKGFKQLNFIFNIKFYFKEKSLSNDKTKLAVTKSKLESKI